MARRPWDGGEMLCHWWIGDAKASGL